jgi:hypothetical protein
MILNLAIFANIDRIHRERVTFCGSVADFATGVSPLNPARAMASASSFNRSPMLISPRRTLA